MKRMGLAVLVTSLGLGGYALADQRYDGVEDVVGEFGDAAEFIDFVGSFYHLQFVPWRSLVLETLFVGWSSPVR